MPRIVALFVLLFFVAAVVSPQSASAVRAPVTGVWKPMGDGLYILTAKHFSRRSTLGGQPRQRLKSSNPGDATAAEKVAAYDMLSANTGTYEIAGDMITFNSLLAKSPNSSGTAGRFARMTFKVDGDTLTLTHPAGSSRVPDANQSGIGR